MKTSTKIIIGLLLVLLLAGLYLKHLYNKAEQAERSNPIAEAAKKQIQTEAAEIKREVDKNGLQHTIFKMVKEIDQSAVDKVNADLLDTIKALVIERDKVRQVTLVNASLVISNQTLKKRISDLATTYSHFDDHFRLTVDVPNDSLLPATFNANYDADLITTQYNKRSWILGANNNYLDIYSNDPRFTIKGARSLTVKQNQPVFGFKLEAKAGYNKLVGPSAGPGLSLRLGNFTLSGDYQYYNEFKQWGAGIGASYKVFGSN